MGVDSPLTKGVVSLLMGKGKGKTTPLVKGARLGRKPAATEIGRRLQRAGFTFKIVAHVAGVTPRMVRYHLKGQHDSQRVADAIATLLGEGAA